MQELELAVVERAVPGSPGCLTRMTRLNSDPARIDDGVVAFTTQALPALRTQPGFCTAALLVDRASGTTVVATTWSSREAMTASAARNQALRDAVMSSAASEVVEVHEYEVVLAGIRPPQQHEHVFRRAYAAMSAGGDLDDLDALIHEDLVEHAPVPARHALRPRRGQGAAGRVPAGRARPADVRRDVPGAG